MSHDQPEKWLQNFRSGMKHSNVRDGDGKCTRDVVFDPRGYFDIEKRFEPNRSRGDPRRYRQINSRGKKSRSLRLCRGFFVTIRFRREIVPRSIHNRFTGKQFLGRKDDRFPGSRRTERSPCWRARSSKIETEKNSRRTFAVGDCHVQLLLATSCNLKFHFSNYLASSTRHS